MTLIPPSKAYEHRDIVSGTNMTVEFTGEKVDPVEYCESHYPESTQCFKAWQREQYELFCKKQMDYGPGNIAMGTSLQKPEEILLALTAIIIRWNDKVQRLINLVLVRKASPENESIEDTLMDGAIYPTIALVVRSGKWGK